MKKRNHIFLNSIDGRIIANLWTNDSRLHETVHVTDASMERISLITTFNHYQVHVSKSAFDGTLVTSIERR